VASPINHRFVTVKSTHKYLADLARNLPVLTGAQALREYFDNNLAKMRRVLRAHEADGFITLSTQLVRPRILDGPLAILKPGDNLRGSITTSKGYRTWESCLWTTRTSK